MLNLTVIEILLSESRPVLWHIEWVTGGKSVKVAVSNQKIIPNLLKLFQKWWNTRLKGFERFLIFFILFNSLSSGKMEKLDCWDCTLHKL